MAKAKVKIMYGTTYLEGGSLALQGRADHKTIAEIEKILEDVCYRDWEWYLIVTGEVVSLAATFFVEDSTTRAPLQLTFYAGTLVSWGMVAFDGHLEHFVVEAAWRAVREFALHEAAEWFRYKGAMVKDPHKEERERERISKESIDAIKNLHSGNR